MDFLTLADNTARQLIDSSTVFAEHRRVRAEALKYAGGMYRKRQGTKSRPSYPAIAVGP